MKKLGWVGVVAGVLLLAGCSAPVGAVDVASAPVASATGEPAPALTAEPVEVTPAEAEFDASIRLVPGLENVDQADALTVGEDVCAQLDAGADPVSITAVESSERINNWDAIQVSARSLCPEHAETVKAAFGAVIQAELDAAS